MFCRQCEQTAGGTGCTVRGVCGKTAETAALQDGLIHALKGIGYWGAKARRLGVADDDVDGFVAAALFTTITNVNFDPEPIAAQIHEAVEHRRRIRDRFLATYEKKEGRRFDEDIPAVSEWKPKRDLDDLIRQAGELGITSAIPAKNEDIQSLREILLYGLKGMGAYADHARILGKTDETVNAFFHQGLAALSDDSLSADDYVKLIHDFGLANLRCMEILDEGHAETFGHPVPTQVALGVRKGPAIVVSGHDLADLVQLLEQTAGTGVNVYTHGEMLPAHGYPELNKYGHLAGHFGSAWQNQKKEFDGVPAAFLFTTNCIQEPNDSYADRVFTTGLVRFPGVDHVVADDEGRKDFSAVIEKAAELGGFAADDVEKEITVGFGHHAIEQAAADIIAAVKDKKIRHFFLIGGCDGAKPGRNYYTEFAEKVPEDCLILTLACGKFRLNRLDLGSIGPFPRLLDCGQCNDAYSAIKAAQLLADAFGVDINDLPLSLILSWYEQKAVCILLTLLSLGVRDIRLGPMLPAFITPAVLDVLVKNYDIKPITSPDEDLTAILGG